jgi:anti-anti-sigma regulatory factor
MPCLPSATLDNPRYPGCVHATALREPRTDLVRSNHLCWVYKDPAVFRDRAATFLAEGDAAGERLEFIGRGTVGRIRQRLAEHPGLAALLAEDRLTVRSLGDIYAPGRGFEPDGALAAYDAATRAAVADGHTGLRVAAEATDLVRTPAQRAAFARYEHLIDRYMVDHPFVAMCAYDAEELEDEATAEIACLHPTTSRGASAFRWHAGAARQVVLAGEVDLTGREVFERTLARTLPLHDAELVVDARTLDFIDHRGLLALEEHAQRTGIQVTLRTDVPIVHRLADLLSLKSVRPASAT